MAVYKDGNLVMQSRMVQSVAIILTVPVGETVY